MEAAERFAPLLARLGVPPVEPGLLETALTHASYAHEAGEAVAHNERLEFLGDAVLGVAVADLLYRRYPQAPEGDLSRMRAALVCAPTLARVARRLGLGQFLRLGHGEEASGGRDRTSVLAGALEAVIGAVYLQHGLEAARRLVERCFAEEFALAARGELVEDFKTALQEWSQRHLAAEPIYRVVAQEGPDHAPVYTVEVLLGGRPAGSGRGRSKKEAEQAAAEEALRRLLGERGAREDSAAPAPN